VAEKVEENGEKLNFIPTQGEEVWEKFHLILRTLISDKVSLSTRTFNRLGGAKTCVFSKKVEGKLSRMASSLLNVSMMIPSIRPQQRENFSSHAERDGIGL
jgi:hypothetical protein